MSISNVRVKIVRMANDNGSNQTDVTSANVKTWIGVANQVFKPAALRFVFSDSDFSTRMNTKLNEFDVNRSLPQDTEADLIAQGIADETPEVVTIICRKGRPEKNQSASSFPGKYVVMGGFDSNGLTLLAHELGHYFGLSHTFTATPQNLKEAGTIFDNLGKNLAALDNDATTVSDTPPEMIIGDQDGAMATSILLRGKTIAFLRDNIMSYYAPLQANCKTITPSQAARINAVLQLRQQGGLTTTSGQIWHNEQSGVGVSSNWSDWHELSIVGNKAKALALAGHTDGRIHAVMAGLDDQIWHNEQNAVGISAAWTGWNKLSRTGDKAKSLALAAHPDGRMHAVMVGLDGRVWHNEQEAASISAAWTGWQELSYEGRVVALAAHGDGRMHAVLVGFDDQLWHNEQVTNGISAAWTDWHLLSSAGDNAKALALAAHSDGRMHSAVVSA